MHQAILAALVRVSDENLSAEPVDVVQVGNATVMHSRDSLHSVNENSVSLSGSEYLASTVAVDPQKVR